MADIDIVQPGQGGGSLQIQEEGGLVDSEAINLNFVGSAVTAASAGSGSVNVTVDAQQPLTFSDGTTSVASPGTVTFLGGATVFPSGGDAVVTAAGPSQVQQNDVVVTSPASIFNFTGSGVSVTDDPDAGKVNIDISGGGTDADAVVAIAEGLDIIAADAATAAQGSPAATTQFISGPVNNGLSSPGISIVSLAANNNIFVNGVYQGGFNLGDTLELTTGAQGDVITSEKGATIVYALEGGAERPVEAASAASAGRQFFWFAFRGNPQRHLVQALALESRVLVYGPNPTVNADGTSPDTPIQDTTLQSFGVLDFQTTSTGEYYILATQPVVVTTTNSNLNQDQRVLQPLTNELFGNSPGAGAGDARISALFANTTVEVRTRTGLIGTGTVSPGSPLSLVGNDGSPINFPRVTNYGPDGGLIVRADGPIAGFSGADAAGTNATTFQPLSNASQVVGLPYAILDTNNSTNDGWSFFSQYEGVVRIFQNDGTLFATRTMTRGGTLTSPAPDATTQLHPAGARITTADVEFPGTGVQLNRGAYAISDVPFIAIANLNEATGGSAADDDETTLFGITPENIRAEIREDINGLLRVRRLDASGVETWEVA